MTINAANFEIRLRTTLYGVKVDDVQATARSEQEAHRKAEAIGKKIGHPFSMFVVPTTRYFVAKMPCFMHPDLDGVETLADLEYRCLIECDLGENGSTDPRWTAKQLRRAKVFTASITAAKDR